MARTTQEQVHAAFARLCSELGPAGDDLSLDHNSAYGGWAIAQNDGARYPFGGFMSAGRLPAGEFVRAMHFAIAALELRANAVSPVVPDRDAAIAALGTGCC